MWDERYSNKEYVYGKEPNSFLRDWLSILPSKGKVLCLAEGEGRNAVFLSENKFDVCAVDSSIEGKRKAIRLATEKFVNIDYKIQHLEEFDYQISVWDGVVSIFAHTSKTSQKMIFNNVRKSLKVGGVFLIEGYSVKQLGNKTGGPRSADMMFDLEEVQGYFQGFEVILARNLTREVNEGLFHTGTSDVIQFICKRIV